MARLPSSILKQLTARAKERTKTIKSANDPQTEDTTLIKAHNKTGNYYLMYDDVIRSFLLTGYSEKAAEGYIKTWREYDMVDVWYLDTYKLIGFNAFEIQRAMI